jgi:methionine-rich copper-binding protein CopC
MASDNDCLILTSVRRRLGIYSKHRISPTRSARRGWYWFSVIAAVLILGFGDAEARPRHVRSSVPAAEAIIKGPHAEYAIRFDGPVDHMASHMEIVQSGRVVQSLTPLADSAPEVLFASGEAPAPGHYILRWWVRSPEDGDVTSGEIPFSVAR